MAKRQRKTRSSISSTIQTRSAWSLFLEEWGRLVIPLGIVAILAFLSLLDIIDDVLLGYLIGLILLGATGIFFITMVRRSEFPVWVQKSSIAALILFLLGTLIPFHTTLYPGTPVFQKMLSRDESIDAENLVVGSHLVEVYASKLLQGQSGRGTGEYRILLGDTELSGRFANALKNVRAGRKGGTRQVADRHLVDLHRVHINEPTQSLKVTRLDSILGSQVQLSIYSQTIPLAIPYVLLGLSLLFAIVMDGLFQEANERWRLGVFMGMGLGFLLVFLSAFERDNVSSGVIWSAIFGGVGGFLGGWLLSFISRKALGKLRTRI